MTTPSAPSRAESLKGPSATRKILILWGIIFACTLFSILICLRPLTEIVFENSPYNYVERGKAFLEAGESEKAVDYLMNAIRYLRLPPGEDIQAYRMIADGWDGLGNEARRDLWLSRARFQEIWLGDASQTPEALEERWSEVSEEALGALRGLGANVGPIPDDWVRWFAARMLAAKEALGAPVEEWLEGRSPEQNIGLLLAGGARLILDDDIPSLPVPVYLQSAGFEQGKGAVALVGGEALIDAKSPGYHVVALDPDSGRSMPPREFNTYADRNASKEMARYLESLPGGWLVLVVVSDEAAKLADPAIIEDALQLIGIELPAFRLRTRHLGYREPFVGMGVKGGKGDCLVGDRDGRPACLMAFPEGETVPSEAS